MDISRLAFVVTSGRVDIYSWLMASVLANVSDGHSIIATIQNQAFVYVFILPSLQFVQLFLPVLRG